MVIGKATARDLRRANRSTMLRALYFDGLTSRAELSQRTGLSSATITNVAGELLAEGCLIEAGSEESQGGRPRTILALNPRHGYFIGADVGEDGIRVELFDLQLRQVGGMQVGSVPTLRDPNTAVEAVAAGARELLRRSALLPRQVLGIGVGVPGIVGRISGALTVSAPSVGWRDVPFAAILESALEFPVFVDNGVMAMAQAEALLGAGKGVDYLAAVLIGTGVGVGFIVRGELYRGATNSAGEWGHTKITPDGRACRCGSHGCLEAYIGAHALLDRWREVDPGASHVNASEDEEGVRTLLDAARDPTSPARVIVAETTRYLSLGIANLINLFNPRKILLGGTVGLRIGPAILPELRRQVQQLALAPPFEAASIELCHLGHDAVALGAATLPLEHFLATGGKTPAPTVAVVAGRTRPAPGGRGPSGPAAGETR